jgi:hypothetical protein
MQVSSYRITTGLCHAMLMGMDSEGLFRVIYSDGQPVLRHGRDDVK